MLDNSEDSFSYKANILLYEKKDKEVENFLHSKTQESSLNISSVQSGKFCCRYCKICKAI